MITLFERISEKLGYAIYVGVVTSDSILHIKEHIDIFKSLKNPIDHSQFLSKFKKEWGFELPNLIAYGDVTIPYDLLSSITEYSRSNGYKCYVLKDGAKTPGLILHEDAKSSWNCLLEKLHKPSHLIIFKIKVNEQFNPINKTV